MSQIFHSALLFLACCLPLAGCQEILGFGGGTRVALGPPSAVRVARDIDRLVEMERESLDREFRVSAQLALYLADAGRKALPPVTIHAEWLSGAAEELLAKLDESEVDRSYAFRELRALWHQSEFPMQSFDVLLELAATQRRPELSVAMRIVQEARSSRSSRLSEEQTRELWAGSVLDGPFATFEALLVHERWLGGDLDPYRDQVHRMLADCYRADPDDLNWGYPFANQADSKFTGAQAQHAALRLIEAFGWPPNLEPKNVADRLEEAWVSHENVVIPISKQMRAHALALFAAQLLSCSGDPLCGEK